MAMNAPKFFILLFIAIVIGLVFIPGGLLGKKLTVIRNLTVGERIKLPVSVSVVHLIAITLTATYLSMLLSSEKKGENFEDAENQSWWEKNIAKPVASIFTGK